jgi:hypothetical protein
VEPILQQSTGRKFPLVFLLKRPLWDGLVLTVGIVYALGIAAFDPIWMDYYSLTKVFKGKPFISRPISSLLTLRKSWRLFVFQHHCVQFGLIQRVRVAKHYWAWKVHSEQNHSIDVLITRLFSILFWFNPVIWLYQKAILQNLNSSRTVKPYWKFQTKAYQITLLKITAHENCVALSNHFINH